MKKKTRIYDNGGATFDRYTIITPSGEMFGASNNPFSPQGFSQFVGEWKGGSTKHLGRKVALDELNEDVRQYVKQCEG